MQFNMTPIMHREYCYDIYFPLKTLSNKYDDKESSFDSLHTFSIITSLSFTHPLDWVHWKLNFLPFIIQYFIILICANQLSIGVSESQSKHCIIRSFFSHFFSTIESASLNPFYKLIVEMRFNIFLRKKV
jgi:hypothetical protein